MLDKNRPHVNADFAAQAWEWLAPRRVSIAKGGDFGYVGTKRQQLSLTFFFLYTTHDSA
jgi:hypothetical protein